LTLTNSIVTKNTAVNYGGGIYHYGNGGSVTLINSSVSYNSTTSSILSLGGGIYQYAANLYVYNSTISNNSARVGGGIYSFYSGEVSLNNATIVYNSATVSGGGIEFVSDSYSLLTTQNTILANNGGQETSPDCAGYIESAGYNLVENTTGCTLDGDLTGNKTGMDPLLLPADGVGYFPLPAASPAVDAGNPATCLPTDQRGAPRAGRCDIGAYEYRHPGPPAHIAMLRGNGQSARLHQLFPSGLQVRVFDEFGTPVEGVQVTFTAPSSGPGAVFLNSGTSSITVTTDVVGKTPSLSITANGSIGTYMVTAVSGAAVPADFSLANLGVVYLPLVLKPDPAAIVDEFPFTDRCGSSYITYNGANMAKMTLCVTGVRIRQDGQMYFDTRWFAEFLAPRVTSIYKNSDAENPNMYITDNLGNRYGHVAVGGAAAQTTYFYPSGPTSAEGWFLFPRAQAGATVFTFHVDDETPPYTIGNLVLAH
jgi:hypothetical protein